MNKPRVVKDYDKLEESIQQQLKLKYPYGFDKDIITFKNHKNQFVSALPFEGDDFYYLIRMTKEQAHDIINDDDDYEDGILKDEAKVEYEENLTELADMAEEDMDD